MAATTSIRILAVSVGLAMLVSVTPASGDDAGDSYELFVGIDDAKVSLISGNFSVAITRDWPRVIFRHETDPFSPTFEVSCPRMYIFNDTDGDGIFDPPEADLTVFLDSNHVTWNISTYEKGDSEVYGQYALVGMEASVHAYVVGDNETLVIPDWARLSFWFFIAEMSVSYDCPGGTYVIDGKTEMRMNFSLSVNVCLDSDGVVLEQFLQGGGSTNTFHLIEGSVEGGSVTTEVSALVDERAIGEDYSHEFIETSDPMQMIRFAKEDAVVNAFYFWGTNAEIMANDVSSAHKVNSSYFTTGAGMTLHSVLPVDNCTTEVTQDSTMGIYESGFIGSVRDWIREYIVPFTVLCGVVVILSLTLFISRRRNKALRTKGKPDDEPRSEEP